MTVFSGKQVVPVNYEAEVSQQLLEACLSSDLRSALDCISDPCLDVNFVGAVCLKSRRSEVVLRDESAGEVRVEYEEFKTDVTALFLAVHSGNVDLVRNLLSIGADVNQKLFRGFATTAAVREGHLEILEILLKAGASQPACEEALLEASCHGRARVTEVLMGSDLIRPHVAVHALVTASCRGFADVVDTLMKCGVDFNATDRLLLLSSKPSLHTNVDCSALVAAVVTRQVDVVRMLLKAGAKTDVNVRLGAWSWDTTTGEEFRVGAGLADPYGITWCAVEYFESTGTVLRMLLQHYNFSPNNTHHGRTLLHYAILCGNEGAVRVLLGCGADVEAQVKTVKTVFRPIHMAARLALPAVLKLLIQSSCDLNSRTDSGDTALMICAKYRHEECLKVLAMAGADFGLVNNAGQSALSIAATNRWFLGFQQAVLEAIKSGNVPVSSNVSVFCPLFFVSQAGDAEALQVLIKSTCMKEVVDLDYQDENGYSAVMFAALHGRVEAFRLLVQAGADVKLQNKSGETAISLSELNQNRDLFEKVMLDHALEKGNRSAGGFHALHCAARHGDIVAAKLLITSRGYDVNVPDGDGYTPLMLAAKGGHKAMCQFLIVSCGADCEWKNGRGETAVSLARGGGVEDVILDELARKLVVRGCYVKKHTKSGAGVVHGKEMRMVAGKGVLSWGKSSRRNVVCRDAEVGGSGEFRKKRESKGRDGEDSGLFRVMTTKNREVHFVCDGGREMAELWVRGIKLVTRDAICC